MVPSLRQIGSSESALTNLRVGQRAILAYEVVLSYLLREGIIQKAHPVLRSILSGCIPWLLGCHGRTNGRLYQGRGHSSRSSIALNHSMLTDQGIFDISTGYAPQATHPHGHTTFLHIQQMIGDH
ncbi:MAG TPA: hypothetical protein PKD12_17950 [Nitrospira sp.]|nr:hypothetical protein [Nitrospira sp.]